MRNGDFAAAAVFATVTAMALPAAAKPLTVCFQTADGKHYLERGTSGGHVRAVATRCKGDSVFVIHEAQDKKRTPRMGKPVVLLAKDTERYVWMNRKKKAAFASKKSIKMRDRRFFFQLNRAGGGGAGAPLSIGDRVSMKSYVKGTTAYVPNGGGEPLVFGQPPKYKAAWGTFTIVKAWRR